MKQKRSGETPALVVPLLLGVLIAVIWRVILPSTQNLGDEQEVQAAVDGTLAGLGLVAGVLTGVYPLVWPGRRPVVRVVALLLTCTIGAAIAWQLGDRLDNPELPLRAIGSAFIWPATTAVVIMIGAIMPWTSRRLELASRSDLQPDFN
ncbi:hypothetical protein [Kineosporia babensis]|uniref:Uncharacterized protein n=1 Tax=Kineosporia babensis TaxID=499548 RepID=A0A9X1NC95_9ACTN|nr:hypothetical protein [Kineosporia babensis]MCD5311468.1 hypothetical protein [Kineosporia babensis]